jgi:uncharacterized protein YjiS (DUF1127 family)
MSSIACCPTEEAPSHRAALLARVRSLTRKISVAITVRAERRALMSLDQATMKDMGFSNGQAHREYGRTFWDVPCDRLRF